MIIKTGYVYSVVFHVYSVILAWLRDFFFEHIFVFGPFGELTVPNAMNDIPIRDIILFSTHSFSQQIKA
jgi:hypothetical protein